MNNVDTMLNYVIVHFIYLFFSFLSFFLNVLFTCDEIQLYIILVTSSPLYWVFDAKEVRITANNTIFFELPPHLRSINTYTAFKSNLKTHLFSAAAPNNPIRAFIWRWNYITLRYYKKASHITLTLTLTLKLKASHIFRRVNQKTRLKPLTGLKYSPLRVTSFIITWRSFDWITIKLRSKRGNHMHAVFHMIRAL